LNFCGCGVCAFSEIDAENVGSIACGQQARCATDAAAGTRDEDIFIVEHANL
jgi:hypothetical protein